LSVSTKSLRRWDKEGKLISIKTPGGHRRYEEKDIAIFTNKDWESKFDEHRKSIIDINFVSPKIGMKIIDIKAFVNGAYEYKFGNTSYEQNIDFYIFFSATEALYKHHRYFFKKLSQRIEIGKYEGVECEKLIKKKKIII
jgi:hypothetical protein